MRLPAPGKDAKLDEYANVSGFTCTIMRDLQRVFGCLAVAESAPKIDPEGKVYLSKVANHKGFSSKITLAMAGQSAWRLDSQWLFLTR